MFIIFQASFQAGDLDNKGDSLSSGSCLHILNKTSEIEKESLVVLKQIQQQLRTDLEKVDRVS